MVKASEIRSQMAAWLDGKMSLSEFEQWFVPATWEIHNAMDREAKKIASLVDLSLSEYSSGDLSSAELRNDFARLIADAQIDNYAIDALEQNYKVFVLDLARGAFRDDVDSAQTGTVADRASIEWRTPSLFRLYDDALSTGQFLPFRVAPAV